MEGGFWRPFFAPTAAIVSVSGRVTAAVGGGIVNVRVLMTNQTGETQNEGKTWKWIVYCSATVPTIPFSLEELKLSRSYFAQDNVRHIDPQDERVIKRYIQWSLCEIPDPARQVVTPFEMSKTFGKEKTLSAIFNHDKVALLSPKPNKAVTVERPFRNIYLADSLKSYYEYHCQICNYSFRSVYEVDVADTLTSRTFQTMDRTSAYCCCLSQSSPRNSQNECRFR